MLNGRLSGHLVRPVVSPASGEARDEMRRGLQLRAAGGPSLRHSCSPTGCAFRLDCLHLKTFFLFLLMLDSIYSSEATSNAGSSEKHIFSSLSGQVGPSSPGAPLGPSLGEKCKSTRKRTNQGAWYFS